MQIVSNWIQKALSLELFSSALFCIALSSASLLPLWILVTDVSPREQIRHEQQLEAP